MTRPLDQQSYDGDCGIGWKMTRIIVIDDARNLLDEVIAMLQLEGFETFGAVDGLQGVQMVRDYHPDLILCDIMMPKLNGYEVLQELRSDSTTASVPFIFMTSLDSTSDIRMGMELGADDYLPKPFTGQQLLSTVNARLRKQDIVEKHLLKEVSQQLIKVQEDERHRVARELHEDFNPILSGLKMLLSSTQSLSENEVRRRVDDAQALVDDLIERVNRLSKEMRPSLLDDLGLLPALQQFFLTYTARTQVRVDFRPTLDDQRLHREVESAAFRIIEESLNNIARHTSVQACSVLLRKQDGSLNVVIEDHGQGFDVEEALKSSKGVGLFSIRQLTISLGGHLAVLSRPGIGTRVIANCPANPSTESSEDIYFPVRTTTSLPIQLSAKPDRQGNNTDRRIRILLAEDHLLIRQGLRRLLENESSFEVIGEAAHERELLDGIETHPPDVLIMDMSFGAHLIPHILKRIPGTRLLVISSYSEEAYVQEALRQGAVGYVLKESGTDELVFAVREVSQGRRFLSKTLSERVLDTFVQGARETSDDILASLTNREREVFVLAAQGLRNQEIADQLFISARTAETHRTNIMRKLSLRTQSDLVRFALRRGIISLEG